MEAIAAVVGVAVAGSGGASRRLLPWAPLLAVVLPAAVSHYYCCCRRHYFAEGVGRRRGECVGRRRVGRRRLPDGGYQDAALTAKTPPAAVTSEVFPYEWATAPVGSSKSSSGKEEEGPSWRASWTKHVSQGGRWCSGAGLGLPIRAAFAKQRFLAKYGHDRSRQHDSVRGLVQDAVRNDDDA